MDTVNNQYFNWLCRTCLRELVETTSKYKEQGRQWQSVFVIAEECEGTQTIAELLSNIIPQIEVNLEDNLSKKICHACLKQLTNLHRFQQMCIKSEREMREMIAIIDATDMPVEEEELHLPKETQQTSVRDPLQNVGEAIEACRNSHEDVNNFVKNEPCDDDEFVAIDNPQEALHSTINVEEETLFSHDSWVAKPERHGQSPLLLFSNPAEVVTLAKSDSPTHICVLCKKKFKESRYLKRHMKRHAQPREESKEMLPPKTEQERPFLCPECGKSFSTSHNLRQHRIRHSDVRPFECPICPAGFYCSGNLIRHKITHEAIKKHICDICGKGFGQNYELKAHKKYHSGEKPFKCSYCEMRFVRRDNVRTHMLTHTGEKPYKCNYCERAFATSGDRGKHLRIHLGENIFGCTLCPAAFRLSSERRAHFVTHKNDDEETRERNMKALKDKDAKLQPSVEDSNQKVDPKIAM